MDEEAFVSEWRPRFGVWVLVRARPQPSVDDRDAVPTKPTRAELSPSALRDLYSRR